MANTNSEAPRVRSRTGYRPDPNFTPNPYDQYDVVHTSEVGGPSSIHHATEAFREAARHDLRTAARALDPNDPTVDERLVVLPTGQPIVPVDADEHRQRISDLADRVVESDDEEVAVNAVGAGRRARERAASREESGSEREGETERETEREGETRTETRHRAAARRSEVEGQQGQGQSEGQPPSA